MTERRVLELFRDQLYEPAAVRRLVEKVNARLRARRPEDAARRAQLLERQRDSDARLERLRRFIEQGDTSAKLHEWLAEAERDHDWVAQELATLAAAERQAPVQVHPAKVEGYLRDLQATLGRGLGTKIGLSGVSGFGAPWLSLGATFWVKSG